jgi:hypothetical protein
MRALLDARQRSAPNWQGTSFPLTQPAFQAVARKLGIHVGIKRSRAIICRGKDCDLLLDAGATSKAHGGAGTSAFPPEPTASPPTASAHASLVWAGVWNHRSAEAA